MSKLFFKLVPAGIILNQLVGKIDTDCLVEFPRETRDAMERFGAADVVVLERDAAGYSQRMYLARLKETTNAKSKPNESTEPTE